MTPKATQAAPAKRAAEAGEQPPAKKSQAQKRNERRKAQLRAAIEGAVGAPAAPAPAAAPAASGKAPCWDFNKQTGCTRGKKCRFQHVCTKCGGRGHGATSCRS